MTGDQYYQIFYGTFFSCHPQSNKVFHSLDKIPLVMLFLLLFAASWPTVAWHLPRGPSPPRHLMHRHTFFRPHGLHAIHFARHLSPQAAQRLANPAVWRRCYLFRELGQFGENNSPAGRWGFTATRQVSKARLRCRRRRQLETWLCRAWRACIATFPPPSISALAGLRWLGRWCGGLLDLYPESASKQPFGYCDYNIDHSPRRASRAVVSVIDM